MTMTELCNAIANFLLKTQYNTDNCCSGRSVTVVTDVDNNTSVAMSPDVVPTTAVADAARFS